jgi:septin family protein
MCCLFCPAYVFSLAALLQVTVIPVIGKADAMTATELAEYRQVVTAMLQQPAKYLPEHGLQKLSVSTFNIDPTVLKALDLRQLPPAVACSRQKEACSDDELLSLIGPQGFTHQAQPVRQHQWGAVYPFRRECHSDIIPLKRLLLGDQIGVLYVLLIDSYKRYWAFCKEFEDYSQELQALVQATCVLGRPLDYDDYRHVHASLVQTQSAKEMLQMKNKALSEELERAESRKKEYAERLWKPATRV